MAPCRQRTRSAEATAMGRYLYRQDWWCHAAIDSPSACTSDPFHLSPGRDTPLLAAPLGFACLPGCVPSHTSGGRLSPTEPTFRISHQRDRSPHSPTSRGILSAGGLWSGRGWGRGRGTRLGPGLLVLRGRRRLFLATAHVVLVPHRRSDEHPPTASAKQRPPLSGSSVGRASISIVHSLSCLVWRSATNWDRSPRLMRQPDPRPRLTPASFPSRSQPRIDSGSTRKYPATSGTARSWFSSRSI